jgi:xanthine dehydrogenase accessory factor
MDIFQEILTALEKEEQIVLATILSTSGSTPASAFSKMIVTNAGTVSIGTIGGGCVESEVIGRAQQRLAVGKADTMSFQLKEDEFLQGLICGGTVQVCIEPVTRKQIPFYQQLKTIRDYGIDCVTGTYVSSDGTIKQKAVLMEQHQSGTQWNKPEVKNWNRYLSDFATPTVQSTIEELTSRTVSSNTTIRIPLTDGELIFEPLLGAPHLIIFGGGHISKSVCSCAAASGFRVTIVDDREQFAHRARFPEATETFAIEFSQAFQRLEINQSTYIVIVTRGHRYDEEILEQALKTPALYIGMIGSQRKVTTTFSRLHQYGFSREQLQRVYAPIGLEIGAITPEEIGISIVAQLVRIRRKIASPIADKSKVMYSFFEKFDV